MKLKGIGYHIKVMTEFPYMTKSTVSGGSVYLIPYNLLCEKQKFFGKPKTKMGAECFDDNFKTGKDNVFWVCKENKEEFKDKIVMVCESLYLIVSLKWSDTHISWWNADNGGYTTDLNTAGLYGKSLVEKSFGYYNDGERSSAINLTDVATQFDIRKVVNMSGIKSKIFHLIINHEQKLKYNSCY